MGWIKIGHEAAAADLTVTGPNTVSAEVAYNHGGAGVMGNAMIGKHAVVGEDSSEVNGTVVGTDPGNFTVTIETRRL